MLLYGYSVSELWLIIHTNTQYNLWRTWIMPPTNDDKLLGKVTQFVLTHPVRYMYVFQGRIENKRMRHSFSLSLSQHICFSLRPPTTKIQDIAQIVCEWACVCAVKLTTFMRSHCVENYNRQSSGHSSEWRWGRAKSRESIISSNKLFIIGGAIAGKSWWKEKWNAS